MLKKLLKKLPSLVPPEGNESSRGISSAFAATVTASSKAGGAAGGTLQEHDSDVSDHSAGEEEEIADAGDAVDGAYDNDQGDDSPQQQQWQQERTEKTYDSTPEVSSSGGVNPSSPNAASAATTATSSQPSTSTTANNNEPAPDSRRAAAVAEMSRNPGEVAFFKLLNSELKKAIHFFEKAQLEFEIREARVREGIEIMRKANSLMVTEKWSLMAKSLYRLYKDLLLLETYAIMTYCSFSKILKKHDKVTKHNTRIAFMKNVVNKANFTHYPKVLGMISRCERLYDEVSQSLILEGKSGLYEDERLFINMIHRLNEQVLDTAEEEGAPDVGERKEKKEQRRNSPRVATGAASPAGSTHSSLASHASQVSTLRLLVEENAMNKSSKEGLARVSESEAATTNKPAMTLHKVDKLAGKGSYPDNSMVAQTLDAMAAASAKSPSDSSRAAGGAKRLVSRELRHEMQQTSKKSRTE